MYRRSYQYSLGGLFAFLTAVCLVLGYVQFVGIWRFVVALGPPLFIGSLANLLMSPGILHLPPSAEYREHEEGFPASIRVLLSLVIGFLIWVPILLALTLIW